VGCLRPRSHSSRRGDESPPSLDRFIRLARALDVPLQRLLTGADRPGTGPKDLAVELRRLGAVDLWMTDALVPGSARRPEEVLALALSGSSPDPRVVEAIPALLSWNEIKPILLRAHGIATKTTYRLAWLADAALSIDRQRGFPGGCHRKTLERFIQIVGLPPQAGPLDDLGRPSESTPKSALWRRWRIGYGVRLDDLARRASELAEFRNGTGPSAATSIGRGRLRLVADRRSAIPNSRRIQSGRSLNVSKRRKARKASSSSKGRDDDE